MNYARFHFGEPEEVIDALTYSEPPDMAALSLGLANAMRRVLVLERHLVKYQEALNAACGDDARQVRALLEKA